MSELTIYHNPRCSKSRQTLELLSNRGLEPTIIRYLETPLNKEQLIALLAKLKLDIRAIIRSGEAAYKDNNLQNPALSNDELLDMVAAHPKLLQRPIVVHGDRAAIGRPPEAVLDIL